MNDRVVIHLDSDGVADVRLNRADKMNAIDSAMIEGILAAQDRLRAEPRLRAVVLHGEGRAFCAGLDTSRFRDMGSGRRYTLADRTHGIANAPQQVAWGWRDLPVPVIAAVHGVAFGGGLQIALGADIRYVTADVKLSVMEIKWGLVPDMAGIALLRELVRSDVARELTYSGRIIDGNEAVRLGLATWVGPDPLAHARELARNIARSSPDAIRAAKRLWNRSADSSAAELLMSESREQDRLIGSPNQLEAVRAAMEQRPPEFSAPGVYVEEIPFKAHSIEGVPTSTAADSDPQWKYVNVRRHFIHLERSIHDGLQWVVFEPNGEPLWAAVRQTVTNFLLNSWRSGALMGARSEEAFFVRCDRTTMTQDDIDNGRLIVEIGMAPVRPAEFVIMRIGLWTASRCADC